MLKKNYVWIFLFLLLITNLNKLIGQSHYIEHINRLIKEGNFHEAINKIDSIERTEKVSQNLIELKGNLYAILGNIDKACDYFKKLKPTYLNKILYYNFSCYKDKQYQYFIKKYYPKTKNFREDKRPVYTRKDSLRGSLNKLRSCYDVIFYNLYVRIYPFTRMICGENEIVFRLTEPTNIIQLDLYEKMEIESIIWNNIKLNYSREFDAIFIKFPENLKKDEIHKIKIAYKGKPIKAKNPPWIGGFVWKKDEENKYWIGVACEHLGASSWWPVKDHLSDKPDSMLINIEVPSSYNVVSNGKLIGVKKNKSNSIYKFKVTYPINNYNVTFYMGKYTVTYDTLKIDNKEILLRYYTLPYQHDKFVNYFKQSKNVVTTFIKIFGDYPFPNDGYGLVQSPYSGMEHQTVIAYGDKIIGTRNHSNNYDRIIVHETAHEWWGNSVTASDMADIWLHEGFATYAELIFNELIIGRKEYLKELAKNINYIYNLWPVVGNYEVNENTFITNDVYNKGAVILHNIRCIINNDSIFFKMIKDYYEKYKYKSINTDTFINFVNNYTNINFNPFFDVFLYKTDLPELKYTYKILNDTLLFTYYWDKVDFGFEMPFTIITDNGNIIRIKGTKNENTIIIPKCRHFYFINQYTIQPFLSENQIDDNIFYGFTYYKTSWIK